MVNTFASKFPKKRKLSKLILWNTGKLAGVWLEDRNIVKCIKSGSIRWLGHVKRMDEERTPKRVMLVRMEEPKDKDDQGVDR